VTNRLQQPISKICLGAASAALTLVVVLAAGAVTTQSAQAQTFSVLYAFTGGADGGTSFAGLIRDGAGNLYGTTEIGGASGFGTVFKVSKNGKETVLYSFTGTAGDGVAPLAGLVQDASSNLYGTTAGGGASGFGTVFQVSKTGKETVLYSFTGTGGDGATPQAGLVRDAKGTLYGATFGGGASGHGTVFMLDKTGKETVLYSFSGGTDGGNPYFGYLIRDGAGNLYGTTQVGGDTSGGCGSGGCGVVFKLDKKGKETVLHTFTGTAGDGGWPFAGVARDANGNLYGTTQIGGVSGGGTVFMLDKTGKETVLYSFSGGADGGYPLAGVVRDAKGNLYGTTEEGGASGLGAVFKVGRGGKETVLHSFNSSTDGGLPFGGVVRDAKGTLYGTTMNGGSAGYGTVWRLTR
jgi:uncharacterized repeat protein (TIGR03803 family)